jgi:hypothetical protein
VRAALSAIAAVEVTRATRSTGRTGAAAATAGVVRSIPTIATWSSRLVQSTDATGGRALTAGPSIRARDIAKNKGGGQGQHDGETRDRGLSAETARGNATPKYDRKRQLKLPATRIASNEIPLRLCGAGRAWTRPWWAEIRGLRDFCAGSARHFARVAAFKACRRRRRVNPA